MREHITEHLRLRVLDQKHTKMILRFYQKNHDFLVPFESRRDKNFYTPSYQRRQLMSDYVAALKGERVRFWLFEHGDNSIPVGTVCFSGITLGNAKSCFVGYKLDSDFQGKGYMREALREGVEIMFLEYGLHRVEANIMPENKKSIAVVESCGFLYEGLSRKMLEVNGQWRDHARYAIVNERIKA